MNNPDIINMLKGGFTVRALRYYLLSDVIQKEDEDEEPSSPLKNPKSESDRLIGAWVDNVTARTRGGEPANLEGYKIWMKIMDLVGSPTAGMKHLPRLKRFLREYDKKIPDKDKQALQEIVNAIEKELRESEVGRISTIQSLSPAARSAKLIGMRIGKKSGRKRSRINYQVPKGMKGNKVNTQTVLISKEGIRDMLTSVERLDISKGWTNRRQFNNLINPYLKQVGVNSVIDYNNLSKDEKAEVHTKLKDIELPELPAPTNTLTRIYENVFNETGISQENFSPFIEGLVSGLTGEKSSDKGLGKLENLIEFEKVILPDLLNAIKLGIVVNPKTGKTKRNLKGPYKQALDRIDSDVRQEVIEEFFKILRNKRPSEKVDGPLKEELKNTEDSILQKLQEQIHGKTYAYWILKTHLDLFRGRGRKSILVSMLEEEEEKSDDEWIAGHKPAPPKEKPKKVPRGMEWNPPREEFKRSQEVVSQSLDSLLKSLGPFQFDDIVIKEDVGLILESLNKKQKKKVKTVLNVADPTEYFGHDFLKLGEIIKVLKTLGVVKGDKKLNKKVLRYDDENLKVVKLATKLRKDYERLYSDLRNLVYPKTKK
jgi:hypothetical protein